MELVVYVKMIFPWLNLTSIYVCSLSMTTVLDEHLDKDQKETKTQYPKIKQFWQRMNNNTFVNIWLHLITLSVLLIRLTSYFIFGYIIFFFTVNALSNICQIILYHLPSSSELSQTCQPSITQNKKKYWLCV